MVSDVVGSVEVALYRNAFPKLLDSLQNQCRSSNTQLRQPTPPFELKDSDVADGLEDGRSASSSVGKVAGDCCR